MRRSSDDPPLLRTAAAADQARWNEEQWLD
jgi:hypothetical protein